MTAEILEILDKLEFFQGQRAGRDLWLDKPEEVQEKDLENFNRDIQKIREFVLNKEKSVQDVLERLEEQAEECRKYWQEFDDEDSFGGMNAYSNAIEIVKEGLTND